MAGQDGELCPVRLWTKREEQRFDSVGSGDCRVRAEGRDSSGGANPHVVHALLTVLGREAKRAETALERL
jgi:hypothetical protein